MPRPTWHYTDVANLWAGDQAECCNKKTATISEDFPRMSILRREHVVSFNIPQESLKMRHYLKSCTTAACKWRHAWNKKMLTVHMFPSICIYICIRYIFFVAFCNSALQYLQNVRKLGRRPALNAWDLVAAHFESLPPHPDAETSTVSFRLQMDPADMSFKASMSNPESILGKTSRLVISIDLHRLIVRIC